MTFTALVSPSKLFHQFTEVDSGVQVPLPITGSVNKHPFRVVVVVVLIITNSLEYLVHHLVLLG
jgi:hypothetical protein